MINGILNVKKEAGFTSHDVVAKLRGILRQKKIGHTGTLDPDATGVLPVCLGKATKLCDIIGDWDKTYEAVLLLGKTTDTEDTSGTVLQENEVKLTVEEIQNIILSFLGPYNQIPPMYSAKKINGKKLYEYARAGITIERKPCHVNISEIVIKEINLPYVTFEVSCSKGTYIRSLCRDIGEKAGCGGCMDKLIRTRVSDFSIDCAYTLSEIEDLRDSGLLSEKINPIDSVFGDYPRYVTKECIRKLLYNGNPVAIKDCVLENENPETWNNSTSHKYCRVYDSDNNFIGIYSVIEEILKPYKLFFDVPSEK